MTVSSMSGTSCLLKKLPHFAHTILAHQQLIDYWGILNTSTEACEVHCKEVRHRLSQLSSNIRNVFLLLLPPPLPLCLCLPPPPPLSPAPLPSSALHCPGIFSFSSLPVFGLSLGDQMGLEVLSLVLLTSLKPKLKWRPHFRPEMCL